MKFGGSAVHNDFGFFQLTSPAGSLSYSGTYTNNPTSTAGTGDPAGRTSAGLAGEFLQGLGTEWGAIYIELHRRRHCLAGRGALPSGLP